MSVVVPVILSGGTGTRLWPLSRTLHPKQLQSLYSGYSMLQETVFRVAADMFSAPMIICNHEHRFIIAEQMAEASVVPRAIVLEPVGRNTAPAAAVAAEILVREDPDALMLLMPSDHLIENKPSFVEACRKAMPGAEAGNLMAFGISPAHAETGYGYIQLGTPLEEAEGCLKVSRFVEKPDQDTAQDYVNSGDYLWNSGLYLFRAQQYLDELEKQQPHMVAACRKSIDAGIGDLDFFRINAADFSSVEPNSIDCAVMELSKHAAVVPVDMGWSDVGSWPALWDISEKDDDGNALSGNALTFDVQNSYVRSSGRLVAALGVKDMVVVATDDAVLVATKDRSQDVRVIVDSLKASERSEHETHTRVYRPWGWYQTLEIGDHFQVKQLMVKQGGILSLQSHQHRAEHWVVVCGRARVTHGKKMIELGVDQSTYIQIGERHRLENNHHEPLIVIEVQLGGYLGEDDIHRYEDVYGRLYFFEGEV